MYAFGSCSVSEKGSILVPKHWSWHRDVHWPLLILIEPTGLLYSMVMNTKPFHILTNICNMNLNVKTSIFLLCSSFQINRFLSSECFKIMKSFCYILIVTNSNCYFFCRISTCWQKRHAVMLQSNEMNKHSYRQWFLIKHLTANKTDSIIWKHISLSVKQPWAAMVHNLQRFTIWGSFRLRTENGS